MDISRFAADFTDGFPLVFVVFHGWTRALIIASGTGNVDTFLFRTADHLEPWFNVKQYKNGM